LIGKYFPYGQERPSATTDGKEKFATYFRDSETGLDYADKRYHQPGMGRFMTPDRTRRGVNPSDPGSWNKYAYVGGDPVNYSDSSGLYAVPVTPGYEAEYCWENPNDPDCWAGSTPSEPVPPGAELNVMSDTQQLIWSGLDKLAHQGVVSWWTWDGESVWGGFTDQFWQDTIGTTPWPGPLPTTTPGWVITVEELVRVLLSNPAGATAALFAGMLAQTGSSPPEDWFAKQTCKHLDFNHPENSPGKGYEWRGSGPPGSSQGNWYNPATTEYLHPDLNHPDPVGPHWDYRDPRGKEWRCNSDGTFSPK